MKIEKIYDKGIGLMNEDQLLIKENLFAVFDGATSLNNFFDSEGKTGGFLASFIAKETFSADNSSLTKLAQLANEKIMQEMINNDVDISKKVNLWSTGFAAIKINSDTLEWAQISDCLILLMNKDNSIKLLVEEYSHDKEIMIEWKNLGTISREEKWNILFDKIVNLRKNQNVTYGVLNSEKEYIKFIKTGSVNLKGVRHIVIFTDGLIPPKESPEMPDKFDDFVKYFLDGGITRVKNKIREMENKDSECQKFPRYKKHDDIAAISITL